MTIGLNMKSPGNSGAFLFINTMKFEVIPKKLKNFWN